MKRIIDGLRYNTETAEHLADLPCNADSRSDFRWHDTGIYRTPRGRYFLAGTGGPMTMWSQPCGSNGTSGGSGIRALTEEEAREYLEKAEATEALEKHFAVEEA